MELLALRAVAPRRAARGGWVEGASLTTTEPPALRGLVLSQRDKTHHLMPATFNRTPTTVVSRDRAVASGMCPTSGRGVQSRDTLSGWRASLSVERKGGTGSFPQSIRAKNQCAPGEFKALATLAARVLAQLPRCIRTCLLKGESPGKKQSSHSII